MKNKGVHYLPNTSINSVNRIRNQQYEVTFGDSKQVFDGIISCIGTQANIELAQEAVITSYSIHYTKLYDTGLESTILTPQTIYNEFSSGQKDLCAIRDYCKYLWDKDKKFKFLLLFGDGSYDNLSNDQSNTNKIITYQSVITSYSIHYTKLYETGYSA